MRYGLVAENPFEWAVLASGIAPTPLIDTWAAAFSRALVAATDVGIFESLKEGPQPAAAVARACGTDPRATEKLLNLLVSLRHLRERDGAYSLTKASRRWLLKDEPRAIRDFILMKLLEWRWTEQIDGFVRTGRPLDIHQSMTADDWDLYQRGMRAQATPVAEQAVRRIPLPATARDMLDIGGSHGYFSVLFCRRYPDLRATILDLPGAIATAAPLLAHEGMGNRVVHRAGNALTDDLGEEAYDFIFMMSLVHHFDEATNRELARRVARALRPGGLMVIGEAIRHPSPAKANIIEAFFDFYFALISESGTWTFEEMSDWQRSAGLRPRKPIRLPFNRTVGFQVADKVAATA